MKYLLSFDGAPGVVANGKEEGDALTLDYCLGDKQYKMVVTPDSLLHQTLGDEGLTVKFIGGSKTVGTLRLGQMSAPYPITCTALKIDISADSVLAKISFIPDGDQVKTMIISVKAMPND